MDTNLEHLFVPDPRILAIQSEIRSLAFGDIDLAPYYSGDWGCYYNVYTGRHQAHVVIAIIKRYGGEGFEWSRATDGPLTFGIKNVGDD